MMDTMYEIPSDDTIGICTITKDVVEGTECAGAGISRQYGAPQVFYRTF